MATARTTALSALIATRRQGAWSDGVLKQYIARDGLDRRDAALASQLCYGVLLYSTCTVLRRENEDVAQAFLQAHPEFCAEVIPLPDGLRVQDARFVTLLPGQHDCDGFFICKMRKQA